MADDAYRALHDQLRASQDKYTYFLLSAAAAAIAFAVNQTQSSVLRLSMVPLGAAVLAWGASFYFGCRKIARTNAAIYANLDMLLIERGVHKDVGAHPKMIKAASEGVRSAIETQSEAVNWLGHAQFRALVTGAVLFVAWHITEMAIRTVEQPTKRPPDQSINQVEARTYVKPAMPAKPSPPEVGADEPQPTQ